MRTKIKKSFKVRHAIQMILAFLLLVMNNGNAGSMGAYLQLSNAANLGVNSGDMKVLLQAGMVKEMLQASDQTIAETIVLMNAQAKLQGHPVFCPPNGFELSGAVVRMINQKEFTQSGMPLNEKLKIPVATFTVYGLAKMYPCKNAQA